MRQQFIWNPRLTKAQKERKSVIESHSGPDIFGAHHIGGTRKGRDKMQAARKLKSQAKKASFGARMAQLRGMRKRGAAKQAASMIRQKQAAKLRSAHVAATARKIKKSRKTARVGGLFARGIIGPVAPVNEMKPKRRRKKSAKKSVRKTVRRVSVKKAAPKKSSKRRSRVSTSSHGGKTMAKRRRRPGTMAGVRFGKAKSQRTKTHGKKARNLPVIYKHDRFNAPTRKKRVNIITRRNPSAMAMQGHTVSLGSFYDSGHTTTELMFVLGAGVAAPFLLALGARVPGLSKLAQIPTWGAPTFFLAVGGLMNAFSKNPTVKLAGKSLVAVGVVRLGSIAADMITAKSGGVKGFMGELLGDVDGYEGYEGDMEAYEGEVEGYEGDLSGRGRRRRRAVAGYEGEDIAALPEGYHGIDFTPQSQVRPFGEDGVGHGGNMAGIDFTPQSQVRPFGALPAGLHGADGRDGANFGAMPGRDGANFGAEYGEYAGGMG